MNYTIEEIVEHPAFAEGFAKEAFFKKLISRIRGSRRAAKGKGPKYRSTWSGGIRTGKALPPKRPKPYSPAQHLNPLGDSFNPLLSVTRTPAHLRNKLKSRRKGKGK
jgi:hypothetical protein